MLVLDFLLNHSVLKLQLFTWGHIENLSLPTVFLWFPYEVNLIVKYIQMFAANTRFPESHLVYKDSTCEIWGSHGGEYEDD
jgi:hypothetical protein